MSALLTSRQTPLSLWDASAVEADYDNPLVKDSKVDVAIIGGGFTGLSTALHCAQKGLNVHVLEAHRIGYGGSGRNAGLVNAGAQYPPAKVRKILGDVYGPRYVARLGAAPEKVFSLIETYQIRCEATRTGTLHAAHAPSGYQDLVERYTEWRRLGAPVDLLDREAAAAKIGSSAFFGGLVDHRAGTINPMGYCRGLARAALAEGAEISTGVRATKLTKSPGPTWTVQTDEACIEARSVVLGTNAYTDALWPGLAKVFTPIPYFQLATEPLGARIRSILPDAQGLWDTGPIMFSLRRDQAKRLIIGSMGPLIGNERRGLSHRWAQKQLARLFPQLGPVNFEEAWVGRIALTPDHIPRLLELDDGLYTPIGYNGRGITTGTLFGEAIAGLLTGDDKDDLPLPITKPEQIPSAPVMSRFYQAAFIANQLWKSR